MSKTYGRLGRRTRALDGVSLEVRRGETVGLIGPNGAGKTTLLSCLLGFLRPDSGSIRIDGRPVDDLRVRARSGYMPERLGFDRDSTGAAFLAFHWRLTGGDPSQTGEREVPAAADGVGLEASALVKRLQTYSRGMLQRIGVAQAMLNDPELLFLDEPASGTDPLGVAIVRERILEAKRRGATIVLNSHQLAEVERVCDRVVFIDHGRLTRDETLTESPPRGGAPSSACPPSGPRTPRGLAAAGIACRARPAKGRCAWPAAAETQIARRGEGAGPGRRRGPRGAVLGRARGALPRGAPVMIEMVRAVPPAESSQRRPLVHLVTLAGVWPCPSRAASGGRAGPRRGTSRC